MESLKNKFNEKDENEISRQYSSIIIHTKKNDKLFLEQGINIKTNNETNKNANQKMKINYIKIDEKNIFEKQAKDFKEYTDIYNVNNFQISKKINMIINKIFNKSCGTNMNYNDDIFLISQNIAKNINKSNKIGKMQIEKLVKDLVGKSNINIYRNDILLLDKKNCEIIGEFLCYCYTDSRLLQYKIKDAKKLIEIRQNITKKCINVYKDYLDYCKINKVSDLDVTYFWKKLRNDYPCLPELIFLFNRYSKITQIQFDINLFETFKNSDLDDANYLMVQLTLININFLLNSCKEFKINLVNKKFENNLYYNYYSNILDDLLNKTDENLKKNISNKNNIFHPNWNFKHCILDIYKEKKNIKEKISSEKNLKSEINKSKEIQLYDIIDDFKDNLELIIICLYSLINFDNYEDLELTFIINDSFTQEYMALISQFYSLDEYTKEKNYFSIFDILISKKNKNKLNLELNSLDEISFEKTLIFLLKNKSLNSLNISLFSSDISYTPQSLYKIYIATHKGETILKNNKTMYLENNILNGLYKNFIFHLSSLFGIIQNLDNLEELGINLDMPLNVAIIQRYKNSILKFILNLLFYISINIKIKKFCLISPKIIFDKRKNPFINKIIKAINLTKATNLVELTINFQFYHLSNIGNFITTRLEMLNIGFLDLATFKKFCFVLCNDNFNKKSSLQKLSIGLLNTIINFEHELKLLLRKLFSVKIKQLISLSLFTNIIIKDEMDYNYILKILNNNWINEYILVFNSKSNKYFKNFSQDKSKLQFLVPHSLEQQIIESFDILKYQNNPATLEIGKNLDKNDDAYWYLMYLFKNKYIDEFNNEHRIINIIKGILKYLHFQKTPNVKFYTDSSFKNS